MVFNSIAFAVFLPTVLLLYYRLGPRMQNRWLLLASWFFYGWWDYRFLTLLGISTVVDFFCSQKIYSTENRSTRRIYLILSLCTNLSVLGFFKYFNFFADSAATLLASFGLSASIPTLYVILPIGISFYTFQTLGYTIDVYRGEIRPCRDLLTFALYVSYFPQLVAGPIERARRLLPQLQSPRKVGWRNLNEGGFLILLGLFKKVGIADVLAPTVDVVFGTPGRFSQWTLLLGMYFFSIQIYCDFSGYSDIARGVSKLFGIELMENFNQPYFSRSITEFWRRWHISLSTWLKDYVYIPLGGNRRGRALIYRNLMITMFLGGLWHGAAWTFVAWGMIHGIWLAAHRMLRGSRRNDYQHSWFTNLVCVFVTWHGVALAWIFFRAQTFADAWTYLVGLTSFHTGQNWIGEFEIARFVCLGGLLLINDLLQRFTGDHAALLRSPWPARGIAFAIMILSIITLGGINANVPFIYFQF